MKVITFTVFAIVVGNVTLAFAQQPCNTSFWIWQGGERVRVCCNQQNFCFTKYGIYEQ